MTESSSSSASPQVDSSLPGWAQIAIALAVPLAAVLAILLWPDSTLSKCEEEIKGTLIAPSTYKRVAVEHDSYGYRVTYDAENSFGAPLRSYGECGPAGDYRRQFGGAS